jgi:hypothetical protein
MSPFHTRKVTPFPAIPYRPVPMSFTGFRGFGSENQYYFFSQSKGDCPGDLLKISRFNAAYGIKHLKKAAILMI